MFKKLVALMLCVLLLMALLPMPASAASVEEETQIQRKISWDYRRALAATGKASLGGFCGLMTSWQLHLMGINRYFVAQDGNNQYDYYRDLKMTTGGYPVRAYSADMYSLEESLNMITNNGTRNAYNILVGFQWTNTEAGATYGHAVVLYAIIDGIVYFTEGFPTSMGTKEGEVIAVSIRDFAEYYNDWTLFEGIIVFGKKNYIENCSVRDAYLFAEAGKQTRIYSLPCTPDMDVAKPMLLRTAVPGERLMVTGLVENTWSQYFYRVEDSGKVGYVPAEQLKPIRFNHEDITVAHAVCPQVLEEGQSFVMGGIVSAPYSSLEYVKVAVYNDQGRQVLHRIVEAENDICMLNDKTLDMRYLPRGQYTYRIYAMGENTYADGWFLQKETDTVCILNEPFCVGEDKIAVPADAPEVRIVKEGWHWENGNWYYYEYGTPRTGWFDDGGVTYYLLDDGAAATGWQQINGKNHFFTDTGAMRTGWMITDNGTYYFLSSGALVTGPYTIEGNRYRFSSSGLLQIEGDSVPVESVLN